MDPASTGPAPGAHAARIVVVTGMAFEAELAAGPGADTLHGLRAQALAAALANRLEHSCAGVLSFGVAGGLDPALRPGTLIVADHIVSGDRHFDTDARWAETLLQTLPSARRGALAAADGAVTAVADKQALHLQTGALAADMESHIAAELAYTHGLPFAACRVVIDPAQRPVPAAALAAMGADGKVDLPALLRALLANPRELAGLLRLAGDAAAARASLRDARRRLGARFGLPSRAKPASAGVAG